MIGTCEDLVSGFYRKTLDTMAVDATVLSEVPMLCLDFSSI